MLAKQIILTAIPGNFIFVISYDLRFIFHDFVFTSAFMHLYDKYSCTYLTDIYDWKMSAYRYKQMGVS